MVTYEIGDVVDKLYFFIPLKCLTGCDSGYKSSKTRPMAQGARGVVKVVELVEVVEAVELVEAVDGK